MKIKNGYLSILLTLSDKNKKARDFKIILYVCNVIKKNLLIVKLNSEIWQIFNL